MADLWSNRHFFSLKRFYLREYVTYSIAEWFESRTCDPYILLDTCIYFFHQIFNISLIWRMCSSFINISFIFKWNTVNLNDFFQVCFSTLTQHSQILNGGTLLYFFPKFRFLKVCNCLFKTNIGNGILPKKFCL